MKKSTLITTIAMIVVVVVALSTATYAWISQSNAVYANVAIGIDPDQNLSVLVNNVNIYSSTTSASFMGSDFLPDPDTQDGQGIRNSIWVPNIAYVADTNLINLKPSADTASSTTIAKISGSNPAAINFITGDLDSSDGYVKTIKNYQQSPDIINVANNMALAQTVTLKIFIGFADDNASRFAASGVCAYVAGTSGLIAETDYYVPNAQYSSGNIQDSAFSLHASEEAFTDSEAVASTNSRGNHIDSVTGTAVPNATGAGDVGIAYAQFHEGYDYYYTLSVELGDFAQNEMHNYLVYTWLDGKYCTNNAKGASIKIVFAFTSVAAD